MTGLGVESAYYVDDSMHGVWCNIACDGARTRLRCDGKDVIGNSLIMRSIREEKYTVNKLMGATVNVTQ